jgi:hypothetical protein
MDFTTSDIQTFKKLYKQHFNMRLSDKLAKLKLAMLVRQMELVYQPVTLEQFSKLNNVDGNEHNEPARPKSDS